MVSHGKGGCPACKMSKKFSLFCGTLPLVNWTFCVSNTAYEKVALLITETRCFSIYSASVLNRRLSSFYSCVIMNYIKEALYV